MTLSEELEWRGLVNQTTYKDLSVLNGQPITFYWGVDPSADSMQIGNLAAAMMVKAFIKHGHRPVLLIGGATGLIGDPDGKAEERQLIDKEQIEKNKQAITNQYRTIFSGSEFEIVDNYDWFHSINYLEFLRDIGKHVPMRQMLGREFVESRLSENGAGISYAEFSYALIQAYDFLWLHENKGVTLQVAGADQWGNSIAGVDLIRRKTGNQTHVYSTPLVIDEVTGRKFGKSEGGAVWLDPNKTSPTEFYQFWINSADQSVEKYLKIFTELDKTEIEEIIAKHNEDPGSRYAQRQLASQVTNLIHGSEATDVAVQITDILTGKSKLASDMDDNLLANLRIEIPSVRASHDSEIADLIVETGLSSSKTEARKLIAGNAIAINGQKTTRTRLDDSDFINGRLIIRRGKAFKDSALIEL
ncbi:MAG TPA: tyrosine--tRNA ligase [Candidatus Saccharimonadales bacterium]|nr:tyrosine--tRNA ligase [Candidatus Saccharimonadales bacterium]